MVVCKGYKNLGLKSPEAVRKYYFVTSNTDMVKAYKPKPYPARLLFFVLPQSILTPHLGWSDFVTGEIKTFNIPGHHADRRQIMNEPFVQFTAKELKKHIDENSAGAFQLRLSFNNFI